MQLINYMMKSCNIFFYLLTNIIFTFWRRIKTKLKTSWNPSRYSNCYILKALMKWESDMVKKPDYFLSFSVIIRLQSQLEVCLSVRQLPWTWTRERWNWFNENLVFLQHFATTCDLFFERRCKYLHVDWA